jgi:hypothetical protein
MYKSTDSGATWVQIFNFLPESGGEGSGDLQFIKCSSDGTKLIGASSLLTKIYISTNSGENFINAYQAPSAPTHVACSANFSVLFVVLNGNIFTSTDEGTNWTIIPNNLNNTWASLDCNTTGQIIYANLETSGTYIFDLTSNNAATLVIGSSSFSSVVDYSIGNNLFVSDLPNNLSKYLITPPVICFKEGSTILCLIDGKETYVAVEKLRKGTLVKTITSGYVPVNLVGSSKIYNPANNLRYNDRLFRLSKDAYKELTEDLILTGGHSVLVNFLTEKQKKDTLQEHGRIMITEDKYRLLTTHDERAVPYEEEGLFNIWNFSLENANYGWNYGVYANGGLLVETPSDLVMKERSGMTLL